MSATIPIMMYHAISEHPAAATRTLSVRPEMFAAQLALLREHGFTPLTFSGLGLALLGDGGLPERPIVLTFDDGYADFHREALPLLTRYGCEATVFVTTGWVQDAGEYAAGTPLDRMLSWSQIDEVSAAGIEIGAHSHSHAQLDQLPDAALRRELCTSKVLLEDRLGREVPGLAYPYGYSSARVRAAVRAAGYRHAAAVSNATARGQADLLALPRLTIRRSTSLDTFRRIVHGQGIPRIFFADRALTTGWAVVRRSRYAALRIRGRG
ncbi:MAG: polysaccharide deacetylase family protein [Pseudonocardiaceae bacterium]